MPNLPKPSAISVIDVSLVDVAAGRRKLDPTWVETLADLFASQGQMTAIEVLAVDDRFRLVFGRHRLAAAKQLEWSHISAVVKSATDFAGEADIILREITENLARRELSVLDKAVDIARWREIYEANHLIAKPGRKAKPVDGEELTARFAVNFSVAAQKAFGLSERSIFNAVKVASISPDVRDRLALHPVADIQSELLQLASEPVDRQASIAALLTSDPAQANTVVEAIATLDRVPVKRPMTAWETAADKFAKLKPTEQERFFALHEAAILLWLKGRSS